MAEQKKICWFTFQPDKHTLIAFLLSGGVIVASAGQLLFQNTAYGFIGRFTFSMLMAVGFGIFGALYHTLVIQKMTLKDLGIRFDLSGRMLLISIGLGIAQALLFTFEANQPLHFTTDHLEAIAYILLAGIFELVFFYGYLQHEFEKAFGVVPSLLLAAGIYSLHHIGFQPGVYLDLFIVGLVFLGIFRSAGRYILVLYPFAWGVGACWDVLLDDQINAEYFRWEGVVIYAILIAIAFIINLHLAKKKRS